MFLSYFNLNNTLAKTETKHDLTIDQRRNEKDRRIIMSVIMLSILTLTLTDTADS